jgi:hypothetical protein
MNASVRLKDLTAASAVKTKGGDREPDLITSEELAALPFEAWKDGEGWTPPASATEWALKLTESAPTLVLAWGVLRRSKQELIVIDQKLDTSTAQQFVENIILWREYFEGLSSILNTAEVRLMSAMANNIAKSDRRKRPRRKVA